MSEPLYRIRTESGLYLRQTDEGKVVSTHLVNKSDAWPLDKANNIRKHLSRPMQKIGKWALEIVPGSDEVKPEKPVRKSQLGVEDDRFSTYCDPNVLTAFRYNIPDEVLDWTAIIQAVSSMQEKTQSRLDELQKDLRQSELERIDILHIIELDPPKGLHEAWKVYKRLRENLLLRRKVKDEIESIRLFVSTITVNELAGKKAEDFLVGLETRAYNYRVKDGVEHYTDILDEAGTEDEISKAGEE